MIVGEMAQKLPARARTKTGGNSEINSGHLQAFVERIERLHEERKALAQDVSEVYAEAKGDGFDVKVLREVIKIRSQDRDARAEMETLVELYFNALGG